jgi:CRP-like cAMP-binding protein
MVYPAVQRVSAKIPRSLRKSSLRRPAFDVKSFLDSIGLGRKVGKFQRKETVFAQGDSAKSVMYIQEGCLAGQLICMATATAIAPTTVLVIEKSEMNRVLHGEHEFSDRFIAYMLARNIRVEEDLIDQLFNSTEKRLARTLLLLARYGKQDQPQKVIAKISQETLADMIGTTRSRVNLFMNKFRKLGFIKYNGGIKINNSLLSVVLHE